MYKIVATDNNVYGPINADTVREWFQDGRMDGQTPVQFAGGDWKPLGDYPEFADLFGGTAAPTAGRPAHSPSFRPLHRAGAAADAEVPLPDDLLARDYHYGIGDIIGRGWSVLKGNFGASILVALIPAICWFVAAGLSAIPFLGCIVGPIMMLASIAVPGPLIGGQMYFFIKNARGWESTVGDTFCGFKRNFLHLWLGYLVPAIFCVLMYIPGVVIITLSAGTAVFGHLLSVAKAKAAGMKGAAAAAAASGSSLTFSALGWVGLCVGVLLIVVPVTYFLVCWFFTLPLCVDRKMNFWHAMGTSRAVVRKHWWRLFFLLVVLYLVNILGAIPCGLGLLITIPLSFATMAAVYEEMFGLR